MIVRMKRKQICLVLYTPTKSRDRITADLLLPILKIKANKVLQKIIAQNRQ